MKEQTRNTEVQINEEETGKLPENEFRIIIVNMIKNLESKMQEPINKDPEELKNKHTNNTITEKERQRNTAQMKETHKCK